MVVRILMRMLAGLLLASQAGADLRAEVDRTRLYSDESLVLTLTADAQAAQRPLDLTTLSTLFEIEEQSQRSRERRTAGGTERVREWRFRLRPRHTGTLAIPNFRLGDARTPPILVTVIDASERGTGLPDDAVRLSAEIERTEVYVGQPFRLTLELDYQVRLQGNFESLDFGDFNAELIDETNTTERDGERQYRRYRLEYRLSANRHGRLTLPPIRFLGQYASGRYGESRELERRHPGFELEVRPIPAEFPDDATWLPAESLTLSDNLSEHLELSANEHLDWRLDSRVEGLPATRLPDPLAGLQSDDVRLYRNAPEFSDERRRDLAALVYTEAGRYQLPAVRLPWWNLTEDRLAWAELPARSVEVAAEDNPAFRPSDQGAPAAAGSGDGRFWPWLSLALALGWLATAVVWVAFRRGPARAAGAPPSKAADVVANPAREADPAAFRAALTDWLVRRHGQRPEALLGRLPGPARASWERLNAALYGPDEVEAPDRAERQALVRALHRAAGRARRRRRRADPDRLYPD